jgi:4-amino-4-deoxy-L-arabinose transferase-like glycosyltransferase
VNIPSPALVTQRAVQRLPRLPLLLLCAAYLLPGLFGRDPWKSADITAFGYMAAMGEGRSPWLAPLVGQLPPEGVLLPHWLGAAFIALLSPLMEPALAARLPFGLLLALTLALTWYSAFHLAHTEAAQPVALAFGGEANAMDYARAVADGALLALMACLGLLQLGHETTPELAQLFAMALLLWGLAASASRTGLSRAAVLAALPLLSACDAPNVALAAGLVGTLVCARSADAPVRRLAPWAGAATLASLALTTVLQHNHWRWLFTPDTAQLLQLGRLLSWFLWPVWLLVPWTLWHWRRHLLKRHIALPLSQALVGLATCIALGGSDRALLLALPALAVLGAFALPTLQRSASAAIDWFSVFFFTAGALVIWVVYAAMQTGSPARTAANIARLAPGFKAEFSLVRLLAAAVGTLAWLALVRWRTARHPQALWKSLVLPAGGVALAWLLVMTLWLPALDYARSYRPWVQRIALHVGKNPSCVAAPGMQRAAAAGLEYFGGWQVDARPGTPDTATCPVLLLPENDPTPGARAVPPLAGWRFVARERRPTDREESVLIYRRVAASR